MTVHAAQNRTPGVRTFYVQSESQPGTRYIVQHVRRAHQRRFFCTCLDFVFRRLPRRRHCKHCREIAALAREAGGISRLAI